MCAYLYGCKRPGFSWDGDLGSLEMERHKYRIIITKSKGSVEQFLFPTLGWDRVEVWILKDEKSHWKKKSQNCFIFFLLSFFNSKKAESWNLAAAWKVPAFAQISCLVHRHYKHYCCQKKKGKKKKKREIINWSNKQNPWFSMKVDWLPTLNTHAVNHKRFYQRITKTASQYLQGLVSKYNPPPHSLRSSCLCRLSISGSGENMKKKVHKQGHSSMLHPSSGTGCRTCFTRQKNIASFQRQLKAHLFSTLWSSDPLPHVFLPILS